MSSTPGVRRSAAETRAPRADALRNRTALVDAARAAFLDVGEDASLEGIARGAGVGIGTLYRHFPRREDLVAAVYAEELDAVVEVADALVGGGGTAAAAFRAWADRYAEFVAAKRGMAEMLRPGALAGAAADAGTRGRVTEVVRRFLDAGRADGSLRDDLDAGDVTTTLVGVFLATRDTTDPHQLGRLLDLVIGGLGSR
ncbi:DNA-binding transcriptional regulator, AcrR family [Microlunatus sagamiharensis]|uniref:DNA-binding transcriptional regulator, AcrR family n=1 Tax=Microlunatus sagamiharensis TaxID=546874 RepID=A0A1H2M087_9ACTN|nr:TetR/AcrR family transcriptional regulator [Microlunatus sagamiharensis]SDU86405.1 DNA-binding transcriptional regulator, AcrR family [Microlunatus sagamiharensis]